MFKINDTQLDLWDIGIMNADLCTETVMLISPQVQ
jgi:hypothetical protein